jgi:CRISPR-associated protein Cas1
VAWRGVLITNPAQLRLDRGCCELRNDEGVIRLAFEDIAYLVLESPQISLTSALLARLAETKTLAITCDAKHLPNGALLPLQGHHQQLAALRLQAAAPAGLKGRLWKRLVAAKIHNQGAVLRGLGRSDAAAFNAMAARVQPGDPDGLEARAARDYFALLFPDHRRSDESDTRNAFLNYAYALIRAGLARALAAQGFHPALGLFHDGVSNPFNLADDLIEPWRPIADLHVARHLGNSAAPETLSVDDRREMARVLVMDVRLGGATTTIFAAMEKVADGLLASFRDRDPTRLPLPEPLLDDGA